MRESRPYGSVRGALSNERPYRVILLLARSCGWRMSGFPLLLGGKQTFGEVPENDVHDPEQTSDAFFRAQVPTEATRVAARAIPSLPAT